MQLKTATAPSNGSFCGRDTGRAVFRTATPEDVAGHEHATRQLLLADVISSEIVPRLLDLFQYQASGPNVPGPAEIAEFAALAMRSDNEHLNRYFDDLRAKGFSLETLFVHFLEPTARYLGELWEQDRCDFIDVTIGVGRLQSLLSEFAQEPSVLEEDHCALLLTTPEEKHLFGIDMVAKVMRAAGWQVTVSSNHSLAENAALAANHSYSIVGVTLSGVAGLNTVARLVDVVRHASCNTGVSVLVGGPAFNADPARVTQSGADACAVDAIAAVVLAKKLLIEQAKRRAMARTG